MKRQREESNSWMDYMDPGERDMKIGGRGAMNMEDPYGSRDQKFPPLGGGGGIGYEANPRVPTATLVVPWWEMTCTLSALGREVRGLCPREMDPGTPAGYDGRGEEYKGPNKKPQF